MKNSPDETTAELYAIERVLVIGRFAEIKPFADKISAAGHTPSLLVPAHEINEAKQNSKFQIHEEDKPVNTEEIDLVLDLFSVDFDAKYDALDFADETFDESIPIATLALTESASELCREMETPERALGFCLLPPYDKATLVELMPTARTDQEVLVSVRQFFESLGLKQEQIGDSPGGVLARTVCCLVNEAAFALQEAIAPSRDIDIAMKLGVNYPQGPLAWGDQIGLDKVEAVMDGLYAWYKEERYRAMPYLRRLVRSGFTGVSAGKGFFDY